MKQPNGPPEFNQKDFSLTAGGFLRRFDDAHIVLNTDEPVIPFYEKIRKLQELKSTKLRKFLAKNKAESDTWRKQNSLAVSHMLSACSGEIPHRMIIG